MGNAVGTPRKVTLDGLTFDVMADANFDQVKGKFDNSEVVTSGKIIQKKVMRAQKVNSVTIQAEPSEADILLQLSERTQNYPMSYETADGSVYRAVGYIIYAGHDTDSGVAALELVPESIDGWALFVA